jgi:hypothetical protein
MAYRGSAAARSLGILVACLLSLILVPEALAGELEQLRESYADKLKLHEKRIASIEAKGRGASRDPETREWRPDGEERKKLTDAFAALQKNLALAGASMATAAEAAVAMTTQVRDSGLLEKIARVEAAAGEGRERLSARWELERAARERQREQREREAGERARGLR